MQPEKAIWTTDVVVPVSKLAELIEKTQNDLRYVITFLFTCRVEEFV